MSLADITAVIETQIQSHSSEQESSYRESELQAVIQEQAQTISMLQSSNQELQSKLTNASEHIKSLTSRAAKVSEIESQNKELLETTQIAKELSDRAYRNAEIERKRAKRAEVKAEEAEKTAQQEKGLRADAEATTKRVKASTKRKLEKYKKLFTGITIFTISIAVLTAYDRRFVFAECGMWFADRWQNIVSFLLWFLHAYDNIADTVNTDWGLHIIWSHIFAIVLLALPVAGMGFFFMWMFGKLRGLACKIKKNFRDGTYKAILSITAIISLLYVCFYLYVPIKMVLPFNIFSVWLVSSLVACLAVNFAEIRQGFRDWRNGYTT